MAFTATGGVKTVDGLYTVHQFTADGSLDCVGYIDPIHVEVLWQAAGGGGSSGGGAAGGHLTGTEILTGSMEVTVGVGGIGGQPYNNDGDQQVANGTTGGDTIFGTRTAKGGGFGGGHTRNGGDGGSGGGGGSWANGGTAAPSGQGNDGGDAAYGDPNPGGGGGGAGAAGGSTSNAIPGTGGDGLASDIVQAGVSTTYAEGGDGSVLWAALLENGAPGADGTGSGGDGANHDRVGGKGGDGSVVVRYLTDTNDLDADGLFASLGALDAGIISVQAELARVGLDQLVFDGDSNTENWNNLRSRWPYLLMDQMGGAYIDHDAALGGLSWQDLTERAAAGIDTELHNGSPHRVLLVLPPSNNFLGASSAASAWADCQEYCGARQAAGWTVVLLTCLPAYVGGTPGIDVPSDYESRRITYHALVRAGWESIAYALVDFSGDPYIGTATAFADHPDHWWNASHISELGHARLAELVRPTLEEIINPAAMVAAVKLALDAVKLKTDTIPASPAAVGSAMVLTSAYDAAKTAAAPGANMVATNMVADAPSLTPVLDAIAVLAEAVPEVDLTPVLDALADVRAKTDTLGALAVTVTSPVAASGTITVEQGDSYSAGRGRPIDVNVDDEAHARGLDAENVIVYLLATQFTWEASSVTETTAGYRVRFEPTIAQTVTITRPQFYKLKACIDNVAPTDDDAETIVRGKVVLRTDIPAVT